MIVPSSEFTLDAADAERTGRSVLRRGGRTVGPVPASQVDAEFAVAGGHVVLLSFGDMFSAVETIVFVDAEGRERDRVTLGGVMEQGLISEITVEGPDAIGFAFPDDRRQRLQVRRRRGFLGFGERWLQVEECGTG